MPIHAIFGNLGAWDVGRREKHGMLCALFMSGIKDSLDCISCCREGAFSVPHHDKVGKKVSLWAFAVR